MKFEYTNQKLSISLEIVNNIDLCEINDLPKRTAITGLLELQAGKYKTIELFYLEKGLSGCQLISSLPIRINKRYKVSLTSEFFEKTSMDKKQYKAHIKAFNYGLNAVFSELIARV